MTLLTDTAHPLHRQLAQGGPILVSGNGGALSGDAAVAVTQLMQERIRLLPPADAAPYRHVMKTLGGQVGEAVLTRFGNGKIIERTQFNTAAIDALAQIEAEHGMPAPRLAVHLPPIMQPAPTHEPPLKTPPTPQGSMRGKA